MPLLCERKPVDAVDFANEDFVVCKTVGVKAGGMKFEMGDALPHGILNPRALAEIYDTPLRLIETRDYAMADEQLLAAMMTRPSADDDMPEDDDEEKDLPSATPIALQQHVPEVHRPNKNDKRKGK